MSPLHIKTPLALSQSLKNSVGKSVYFKCELLQPPGSFKLRGIGHLCQHEVRKGCNLFVASSGGNAGAAVAYCGMKLGVPTTVFIPSTSHQLYIDAIKGYGADVKIVGDCWDEAHEDATDFAKKNKASYIPPFDHPLLWEGYATMVPEMILQGLKKPDVVVLSVGGGGLACGVLEGMHQVGWDKVPLITVGTIGADAFDQSIKANKRITLPAITSKATSLGVKCVAAHLLEWVKRHEIRSVVVSDEEAKAGCFAFAHDQRMLVELASGASLSVVYQNHPIIQDYQSIIVIACGGINTSIFGL